MNLSKVQGHELVIRVAREMAEVSFDQLMLHDKAYTEYKERQKESGLPAKEVRRRYVQRLTPFFIQRARATLTEMLTSGMSEVLKEQIADALIKDHAFQAFRTF